MRSTLIPILGRLRAAVIAYVPSGIGQYWSDQMFTTHYWPKSFWV